jgi:hypothetical protein
VIHLPSRRSAPLARLARRSQVYVLGFGPPKGTDRGGVTDWIALGVSALFGIGPLVTIQVR